MAEFQQPAPDDKPFLDIGQDAIDVLERITPAEKAQAVPHVRLWWLNPEDGTPVHKDANGNPSAPLSLQLNTPPRFGEALDGDRDRFRERPPVSLERITIKTDAPKNIITYRTLEFQFTVHRPDVIFEDVSKLDHDSWATLIIPGYVHVLEYGWRASPGVQNGILNGLGEAGVPALRRIRFTVTNYNFRILTDNQMQFTITAFEDSEFNLRHAELGGDKSPPVDQKLPKRFPTDGYNEEGQKLIGELQKRMDKLSNKVTNGMVSFKDILDEIYAPSFIQAYKEIGYNEPTLQVGLFNERVGQVSSRYKLMGKGIGDFQMPFNDVRDIFSKLITKTRQTITLRNFLEPFFVLIRTPATWNRKDGKKEGGNDFYTLPQIVMRTIDNPGTKDVTVLIFDAQREFTKFSQSDYFVFRDNPTRDQLRQILKKNRVPLITFGKGNSYLGEANFEVTGDEQMKGIFMNRYLAQQRKELSKKPNKAPKVDALPDASKVLYSSALTGELNMIGNFALDLFGLIWLDFGVDVWSGPFTVLAREDVIERGSFVTRVQVRADGSDPLGTQGRAPKLIGPAPQ